MKYLSRILSFIGVGLLMAACTDSIDEVNNPLVVSAPTVSAVSSTSAYVAGTATGTHIVTRGFVYGTSANPTVEGLKVISTTPNMAVTLSSLTANTTYYVRGYAQTNDNVVYSSEVSFTTKSSDSSSELDAWKAPAYNDDYRSVSIWNMREHWNLGNVHDPTVVKANGGYYYMYTTDVGFGNPTAGHGHFHGRRSPDLVNWEYVGPALPELPAWVPTKLNEIRANMGLEPSEADFSKCGYWAPCVRKVHDGLYRMYYVITIDGTIDGKKSWSERAFIGLLETADPAANNWVDKGFVITNYSDKDLNFYVAPTDYANCYFKYNAIDPSYIITPEGQHWLIYGSWHSGFAAVQLNPETGKTVVDPLPNPWGAENEAAYGKQIWTRTAGDRWQASEAPEVIYHDGYYYLFVAYDALGTVRDASNKVTAEAPYNTRVLRSQTVDGWYSSMPTQFIAGAHDGDRIMTHPYRFITPNPNAEKDEDKLDDKTQGWTGISHCAIFDDGNGNYYYVSQQRYPSTAGGSNPDALMLGGVRSVKWLSDGWPTVMPERYAAVPQVAITKEDIVGDWEVIDLKYNYGKLDASHVVTFSADGKATYQGSSVTWSFNASTNTLIFNGIETKVQRECDWEAIPRKHTIVFSGGNYLTTIWGKKK